MPARHLDKQAVNSFRPEPQAGIRGLRRCRELSLSVTTGLSSDNNGKPSVCRYCGQRRLPETGVAHESNGGLPLRALRCVQDQPDQVRQQAWQHLIEK